MVNCIRFKATSGKWNFRVLVYLFLQRVLSKFLVHCFTDLCPRLIELTILLDPFSFDVWQVKKFLTVCSYDPTHFHCSRCKRVFRLCDDVVDFRPTPWFSDKIAGLSSLLAGAFSGCLYAVSAVPVLGFHMPHCSNVTEIFFIAKWTLPVFFCNVVSGSSGSFSFLKLIWHYRCWF